MSAAEQIRAALEAIPTAYVTEVTVRAFAALDALEAEHAELREAAASALTSLGTGPLRDGYAYSVLDAAMGEAEHADKVWLTRDEIENLPNIRLRALLNERLGGK